MDKNAIKKYAVWARRELISRVTQRAAIYGITADGHGDPNADSVQDRVLTAEEKAQRKALIAQVKEKGFEHVMEEIAYTWFNRFSALRFMEVNGYLPSRVRVFTDDENRFKPQLLTEAINLELDGLDMQKVYDLKNANDDDALFKYLLITQCNALSAILPGMFQKIDDYTELLFPDNLLREGSVVEQMVAMIPQEDWTDQVQIIGWLYQYYNTEPKDQVFANLKKNIKITKENIPAATQLFTPDWIVHYMVENSLGRLWIEHLRGGQLSSTSLGEIENLTLSELEHRAVGPVTEDELAKKFGWKYYLAAAEQEPEVEAKLAEIRKEYAALKPEEIKVIDPCCGSGHILCVLFDVLIQIYEDYGYTAREAAQSIVRLNLYGLDIDPRATQLAYFSVMMKARQYDRRFFSRNIQPMVYSPEGYPEGLEYGSLITVDELEEAPDFDNWTILDGDYSLAQNRWNFRYVLSQKYHVVVTNPPYMGASNMNPSLSQFIKESYPDYKSDSFSAFMVRCSEMTKQEGYCGFFTPYVWMFIQSYEKLRQYLYSQCTIETLIQFEYSAFEEATVPVCTLAFKNSHILGKKGCYFRLTDFRGGMEVQRKKTLEAIADHSCGYYFEQTTDNFSKIPGAPVAYWLGEIIYHYYRDGIILAPSISSQVGTTLGDNGQFMRLWYEVSDGYGTKWFFSHKGGSFRRWYGNVMYIINWENNGKAVKDNGRATVRGERTSFNRGISWTQLTAGKPSFRIKDEGTFVESASCMCSIDNDCYYYLLAYLNSTVAYEILDAMNPTMHFQPGDIGRLPWRVSLDNISIINQLVDDNITISRSDWDSFETSWDFKRHPLIPKPTERG